jgi:hypothetical protein
MMSKKKCGLKNLRAHRDEVVVLSIVEGCMKRKDKVISAKRSKSIFLIDGCVERDSSYSSHVVIYGVLVDGFESIQAARVLLSHKVNGRIKSLTQGAQELVIIEARVAVGRLGTNGAISSLEKKRVVGGYSKPTRLERHPGLTSE